MLWFFVPLLLPQIIVCSEFSYGDGVKDWSSDYCYNNKGRQSPININTYSTSPCLHKEQFMFEHYETPVSLEGINNGHTVKFTLKDTVVLKDGGLKGSYTLAQFHFHWGSTNSQGSEHTVNGERYALAAHFVHTANADTDPSRAYAAVGVFFKVGSSNKGIDKLIENISQLKEPNANTVAVTDFKLDTLLPNDHSYYRYVGSFTTPTCDEVVIWSVMKSSMTVSQDQLKAFRSVLDSHNHQLQNNFRPTQKLNGRVIFDCDEKKWKQGRKNKSLNKILELMSKY